MNYTKPDKEEYEDMYDNMLGLTLEEFVKERYSEIGVEVERTFDQTNKTWKVDIVIQKPVVVKKIETVFTLTPDGVKYNNK